MTDTDAGEMAPTLGRDALSGRLERALRSLEGQSGPATAWKRAWLLTALGRYGEALDACAESATGSPVIQSCTLMTEAMLYRQVGLHARAEEADDGALDILRHGRVRNASVRASIRIGQVANGVGLGMEPIVLSRRLQIAAAAVTAAGSWRQGVRLTWVRGEVLMARGAYRRAAGVFAGGARIARDQKATRHQAKSLIFLSAASAASGDHVEARRIAERGLQLAAKCGASPLIWPAELILAEVDTEHVDAHLARARQFAGGILETLPATLRTEALRRPPATWLLGDEDSHGDGGTTPATDA